MNFAAIERTYQRLDGAWVNLYRDTDPLAGPVLSWHDTENGLSEHFPAPYAGLRPVTIVGRHGTMRHSNYWASPDCAGAGGGAGLTVGKKCPLPGSPLAVVAGARAPCAALGSSP